MYAILRMQKIKNRTQLASAQNHNLRLKPVINADPTRTHLNRVAGAKDFKSLIAELEDKFRENDIKPRKDAVQAIEFVLSASPEFFNSNSTLKQWVKKNWEWAKKEFGKNLLQTTLHLDETTPHLHLIITPITQDGRLSCKDMYGGKEKLSALQNRYAKAMEELGLKRGIKKSQAKHTTIKEFYHLINELKKLKPYQVKQIANNLEEFEKERTLENNNSTQKTDYENILKRIVSQEEFEIKNKKMKKHHKLTK